MRRCPFCGRRASAEEAWQSAPRRCACGAWLLGGGPPGVMAPDARARWEEGARVRRFQRQADRICALILREDVPEADIALARAELRETCARVFPDRLGLYEMIYESRFDRLWRQFREPEGQV